MSWFVLALRLVVAGSFVAAALGKSRSARSFAAFRESVTALGRVPARRAVPVAVGVVALEWALAIGLLFPSTSATVLAAAAFVLAVFTAFIVRAIRSGQQVSCNCFGATQRPVGGREVARNVGLIVLCLVALAPLGRLSAAAVLIVAAAVLGTVAVLEAAVISALLRRLRAASQVTEPPSPDPGGPAIGASLPDLTMNAADGSPVRTADLVGGRTLIGLFSSNCGGCRDAAPDYTRLANAVAKDGTAVVTVLQVLDDEPAGELSGALAASGRFVPQTMPDSLIRDLGVRRLPAFFVLDESGRVAAKGLRPADVVPVLAAARPAAHA